MQARAAMARNEGFHFAIIAEDLPNRPMVGACSAAYIGDPSRPPELAYWIAPEFQRRGLARHALTILLSFLFARDENLRAIEAAVIEGWTDIAFHPESVAENFLGSCPNHSD